MAVTVGSVGKVEIVGTVSAEIREPGSDAPLDAFERATGMSPGSFVAEVRRAAAERCEVVECPLRAVCQDEEDREGLSGNGVTDPDQDYAARFIRSTVTCDLSDVREGCTEIIAGVANDVQTRFDEVAGSGSMAPESQLLVP